MYGALPPDGVRALLDDADVFVHASLGEGISNGVLEAMASGLPVVTTDCGGMREAVTDGQDGFVVPVRDVAAMSAALVELAGDAGLRTRMGRAARAAVERGFALEQQIASFASLYERLAASRVSGASTLRPGPYRSELGLANFSRRADLTDSRNGGSRRWKWRRCTTGSRSACRCGIAM